jgi:hypothetical protein
VVRVGAESSKLLDSLDQEVVRLLCARAHVMIACITLRARHDTNIFQISMDGGFIHGGHEHPRKDLLINDNNVVV